MQRVLSGLLILVCTAACTAVDNDTEVVLSRLFDFYLRYGDCTQTQFCTAGGYWIKYNGSGCERTCDVSRQFGQSLNASGAWEDVDYYNQDRSFWQASEHLERTLAMVRLLSNNVTKYLIRQDHITAQVLVSRLRCDINTTTDY